MGSGGFSIVFKRILLIRLSRVVHGLVKIDFFDMKILNNFGKFLCFEKFLYFDIFNVKNLYFTE